MTMIHPKAMVIGTSAGGVTAMRSFISQLTRPLPWPMILVQHIQAGTRVDYASVFGHSQHLRIMEAESNLKMEPGTLYVAPPGYHTLVELDERLALSMDPPVNYSRPSIDILFESAAEVFGSGLIALLLTGANHDGAAGMEAVQKEGGLILIQDPETAEVPTMPAAALARVAAHVLPLEGIAAFLEGLAVMPRR